MEFAFEHKLNVQIQSPLLRSRVCNDVKSAFLKGRQLFFCFLFAFLHTNPLLKRGL